MIPSFDKQNSESGISYYRQGSGPHLVLIHGVGLRGESWHRYIELLIHHFDLIILDLPGHGDSNPLSVDYQQTSLPDYVQAISEFVLEITEQPFYLCGHSLGSLIAIEIATTLDNKVLAFAALNAIEGRSNEAHQAVQARAKLLHDSDTIVGVQETVERWFGESPDAEQQHYASLCDHWLRNNNLQGYAAAYKAFADQRGPSAEALASIDCPSLYMTGEFDLNSSSEMTHRLAKLSASNSKAVVIENAGHMMPLSHAEDVSNELIKLKNG